MIIMVIVTRAGATRADKQPNQPTKLSSAFRTRDTTTAKQPLAATSARDSSI